MARRSRRSRSRSSFAVVARPRITISAPLVRSSLARRSVRQHAVPAMIRSRHARILLGRQPSRRSRVIPGSIFTPVERSSYVARRKMSCRQKANQPTDRLRFSSGIGRRQWAISRRQRERKCS